MKTWLKSCLRTSSLLLALVCSPLAHSADEAKIKGTVKIAPDLAKDVTANAVLYVIARPEGTKTGPPAAVVRMGSPKFPQSFEIGSEHLMMGGDFKGPYELSVKLSKTGDVITSPGDLLGEAEGKKTTFKPGDKDVTLLLKTKAK